MSRRVVYWVGASVYLAVVALAVVLTGPTVIHGADGLEIGPLLLLGLPSSIVLIIVGGWGMLPFGDTASDWGALVGLVAGSLVNVLLGYRILVRKPSGPRSSSG